MRRPITRILNAAPSLMEESELDVVVKQSIEELAPDVLKDPLFDVESRDRGGYFASFAFVSEPKYFDQLASKRLEISELASKLGVNILLYPQTLTS